MPAIIEPKTLTKKVPQGNFATKELLVLTKEIIASEER